MPLFGKIIVIKRNGTDGIHFPLTASSCLFGRKTECDIRIQLPQVSKEHCKIEVNENKEAVLTNLSAVNPTQLNGGCFQQPVPLKHGDVLTIIDRSFRFEYPPQSTPRKRHSRSPKNETLQVLHVQQVAEVELLHKQASGSKSLPDSDNTKSEKQNADENKQSTEENKVSSVKLTTKSLYRINRSNKRENEMSPFSKLYETLKHEIKVKKTLQEGNASQQARKDGKSVLLESSTQMSSDYARSLGSLTKETEKETTEEYKVKQEVVCSEFNLIAATGSAAKKSFTRSPRKSASNEMSRNICRKILLQDYKEQNTLGKPEGTEVATKANEDNNGNAACSPKPCSIECLGYADRISSSARKTEQLAQTSALTNAASKNSASEVDTCVLSTPRSKRRSSRSRPMSSTKEISGMGSVNVGAPTNQHDVLLEPKFFSEISAEPQEEDVLCRSESLEELPLAENACLKQRRGSKQHTPGKSIKEEALKENCDQADVVNSEERDSETPASLPNSKSPRRNIRRSKALSNDGVCSEMQRSEELTPEVVSPASQKNSPGRKRGRPRTSELLSQKAVETEAFQDHQDKTKDGKDAGTEEELVTKADQQKLDLEGAGDTRPRSLSAKRRSGCSTVLKEDEVVAETSISSLLANEEESGNTRGISQKRKSGDLLHQPLGKRKRVSFGGHLSPELFDKSLPPNSPLKRGAIPARLSVPFGGSPRAVLKKAQGSKPLAVQELPEHLSKEKTSPKQRSPAASCPVSGKSTPKKSTPKLNLSSPEPYTTGRFSVSHIPTPSPVAEEQDAGAKDVNPQERNNARVKTPNSSRINQDDETLIAATNKLTRSAQLALKNTPMKRRSGAVAVINAKRRSGASSANLLVAKSWAEVVKLGVARPQAKAIKKSVLKGRSTKKITQLPKTPERKVKGHFSTGHAESPATIVVGRAYTTTVRMAGQVPKVVKNPIMKQSMDMNESFTGMAEMFQTPENKSRKGRSLSPVQKIDFTPTCSAVDVSELHTPEESGEMIVSPLNSSDASEQKPDICHFLRDESSLKSMVDAVSTNTPEKQEAMQEENAGMDSLLTNPKKCTSQVKLGLKGRTPKQKLEPVEVLSGVKQLMRTPKQKPEPVDVLSGVKRIMKTPKQKPEPVEVLSGVKQLMRTPKQKSEATTDEIGFKRLLKTPVETETDMSSTTINKTPKTKYQPVEDMIGISRIFKTPKEKAEPVEDVFGISRLVRTPKEKYEPVEDFVGLKKLMAEPRQKCSDIEVEFTGVKEMFDIPEEIKTCSVKMDLEQEDTIPPCANSTQECADKGKISEGEKSQQTVSASKEQCTKRQTRGRPRKTVRPVSVNQHEKNLEEDANVKEMKALEKKSIQEEMEVANASVAKSLGRGRRTNRCVREETVSEHMNHKNAEAGELCGAAQRPRRGKRNEPKQLKHQSESVECRDKDSSLLQEESANVKQTLQKYGVADILITEAGQGIKTESMSSHVQNANCQPLQTEFEITEHKSKEGSIENSETLLLPPRNASKGEKELETTEPVISPRRGRRRKNDQGNRSPSEEPRGTARKLRKEPSAKIAPGDEQALDKNISETALEKPEVRSKQEIKVVGRRGKSIRTTRKQTEIKTENCRMAPEDIRNIQEAKEAFVETVFETQSDMKNERKVSRGKAAENVQENATEVSQRLKSESPSGETNKAPAADLRLETSRTRNRRGKKDSLEIKADEPVKDASSRKAAVPKLKSEAELEETSVQGGLSSPRDKDVNEAAAAAQVPVTDSDSMDHNCQKQAEDEQEGLEAQPVEIVQEGQTQINRTALRRGRGRRVNFELEEANSKALGKSLPGDGKGIADKGGQPSTSENASSQVRRSRRRQVASIPPTACSTSAEKLTVIEDHSKDETLVKDQDPALEATLSSAEENPLRWGRRGEVAVASQTTGSLSVSKRRGLPEGDDKKMPVKEDQNTALGNKTSQAKSNASARDKRKKIDPAAEAKSSSSLQRKHGLSETDDKEKSSNEEQNLPLETVSPAREKPLGRGRRKETALMSHPTNCISLRGRRGVPADNGGEKALKENQEVPLEAVVASSVKETQLRRGRRKEVALLSEATSSTSIQRKRGVSEENKAEKVILENTASQEKMNLVKANLRQKAKIASLEVQFTSPQGKVGLQDSGKNETREEQQSCSVEVVPPAHLSRASRKRTVSFKPEEAASTFLREKRLPKDVDQKDTFKEDKNSSLDNNSSREKARPLRNKSKKTEFESEEPASAPLHDNGNLPENGSTSKMPDKCLKSTDPPKSNPPRRGREVNLVPQVTTRRRKCQLPEDDSASKKLKSENDENSSLQKGRRNKTKEELDKWDGTTQQTAGGTDRKTRSRTSTRTRH